MASQETEQLDPRAAMDLIADTRKKVGRAPWVVPWVRSRP